MKHFLSAHLRRRFAGPAAAVLAVLIAGCGGGGDTTPPTSAVSSGGASTTTGTCGLADFNASVLARVNQIRAAGANCRTKGVFGPAGSLGWSTRLAQAADGHSRDMVVNNFFGHTSNDGRTLIDRVNATGYTWRAIGENIAAGSIYSNVNAVIDGWLASDGHCENLLSPAFTEVGVACVPGTSANTYSPYWTMDLGQPR